MKIVARLRVESEVESFAIELRQFQLCRMWKGRILLLRVLKHMLVNTLLGVSQEF